MQQHEQAQFFRAVGLFVAEQVSAATAPLLVKIAELEDKVKKVDAGWEADMIAVRDSIITVDQVRTISSEVVTKTIESDKEVGLLCDFDDTVGAALHNVRELLKDLGLAVENPETKGLTPVKARDGKDGQDVDMEVLMDKLLQFVEGSVIKYFRANPVKDGKDVDMPAVLEMCKEWAVGTVMKLYEDGAIKSGKDGEDGKSIELSDVEPLLRDLVDKAVAVLPVPVNVVGGLIDRDGCLCLMLSDGSTKNLGKIVGKDGEPGTPGAPGRDGLGFKDMSATFDGERGFGFRFVLEDRVEELKFTVPFVLYRGVWKPGSYKHGDQVTRDGSQFVAMRDTDGQPGTIDSGWQLSTKRGRDGKDLTQSGSGK